MSKTIAIELEFPGGYIAHPFWTEQTTAINIQKKSGMNLARGEAKRKAALKAELDKQGISESEYEALLVASARPFHVTEDGYIYIPSRNVESFIAHVAQLAPRAMRAVQAANAHSHTRVTLPGLVTPRTKPDGTFTRFVKLEMSNQRSLQSNDYIEKFVAKGTMVLSDSVKLEDLKRLFLWGGEEIGIGAARSQGYGRFTVKKFE